MQTFETIFLPTASDLEDIEIKRKIDELKGGQTLIMIIDQNVYPVLAEIISAKGNSFTLKKTQLNTDEIKVEIKTATDNRSCSIGSCSLNTSSQPVDITKLEPGLRHDTIFRLFDNLKNGEDFCFINDHDPKPLQYQMQAEKGDTCSWVYQEKGPATWKVQIKKTDAGSTGTIGSIVAADINKAAVFKKYGIDFCCGGKKSLLTACQEKGLDINAVLAELQAPATSASSGNNYNAWTAEFLAEFIYNRHHLYYYTEAPVIREMLAKVVERHGSSIPELVRLQKLFTTLAAELDTHFAREEQVLFPYIKALSIAKATGNFSALKQQPSLQEPLQMMEVDHEAAGDILREMNRITNGFTPHKTACNSLRFLYKKLQDLEEDLYQHIHLENNVLFPKALHLDKMLRIEEPSKMNSSK